MAIIHPTEWIGPIQSCIA